MYHRISFMIKAFVQDTFLGHFTFCDIEATVRVYRTAQHKYHILPYLLYGFPVVSRKFF